MDGGNASLLFADKLTDIALTGTGTIDGGGEGWWGGGARGGAGGAGGVGRGAAPAGRGAPTPPATPPATPGAMMPDSFFNRFATFPVAAPAARAGGRGLAQVGQIRGRPKLILLTSSQRILIDGLTIQNSPMWQVVPVMCTDVTLENLKVNAPQRSPNTDALNPTACTNVLVRNCDLSVGDDNIALKALGGPNSNIWIENVHSKFGHGISIGSETYGGVHDVTVVNCTFDGGDNAIRIKSARDRGNQLFNFTFSNITIDNVKNPILITMYYSGSRTREVQPITATTPFLKNVKISDVKIRNAGNAGQILGLPEAPATNVVLTNVDIEADTGMTIQDVKGCIFDHVKIKVKSGEPIKQMGEDLTIKN
jgi:polygalacturonase